MEILGYRFNRTPMLRLAEKYSLRQWIVEGLTVDSLLAQEAGAWSLQGVRPANHTKIRLRQYLHWARISPDWPEALAGFKTHLPRISAEHNARVVLRECRMMDVR